MGTLAGVGAMGFVDDFVKVTRRRSLGLSGRGKLVPQFLMAFAVAWAIEHWAGHADTFSTVVTFPFLKKLLVDLGIFYIPFVTLVVVGVVERREPDRRPRRAGDRGRGHRGGDVHASWPMSTGNAVTARYLQIATCPQSGELSVFCGALVGAALGFLWFNAIPPR